MTGTWAGIRDFQTPLSNSGWSLSPARKCQRGIPRGGPGTHRYVSWSRPGNFESLSLSSGPRTPLATCQGAARDRAPGAAGRWHGARARFRWLRNNGHTMSLALFERMLHNERRTCRLAGECEAALAATPTVPMVDAVPLGASLVEEDATVQHEAVAAPPERTERVTLAAANTAPAEDSRMHVESFTPPGSRCNTVTSVDSSSASVVHGELPQAAKALASEARFVAADLASNVQHGMDPRFHMPPRPNTPPTADHDLAACDRGDSEGRRG